MKIRDVAQRAGVSTATVSRALTNPELLAEATRIAVFDAIRDTGYRVNQAARNLRKQRAGAVLILVPNLGNPFFSQILAGIGAAFAHTDFSVLIADTMDSAASGRTLTDYFLDARIDGMIVLDGQLTAGDVTRLVDSKSSHHVVFACEWIDGMPFPSVRSDNLRGAELAIRHLYDLGHRKIAHITGPAGNVLTLARRQGMVAERARLNLETREEWIIRGDFSLSSGYASAAKIVAMKDRPTAVFCASDQIAYGLISGLNAAGLRVPDDISVVGFDDIELSEFYIPSLTTIRQNRPELGRRAARTLLTLIEDEPVSLSLPQTPVELIDVELIVRQSTGPVPA
ncbi:LacI family DNA-binding transcriptional regulator [Allorhizobium sp. BGMRC 0089]|nr:LacI family DNA-binding transcriptional regulator [Allorhizobium sonneratiae]